MPPTPHPIDPAKCTGSNIGGFAYEVTSLPTPDPGRTGPFVIPPAGTYPPKGDFPAWVEYYLQLIGAYVELLDGIEFHIHSDPTARMDEFQARLCELAARLGVSQRGSHPKTLVWPLHAIYQLAPAEPILHGDFAAFIIRMQTDYSKNTYGVMNLGIEFQAETTVTTESSSSSYLATSSSSG